MNTYEHKICLLRYFGDPSAILRRTLQLGLILATLVFVGCKDRYCPGFPDDLTDILPYTPGQTIRFMNENGDYKSWKISGVYQQHPEEYTWCEKCSCEDPTMYNAKFRGGKDTLYGVDTILNITIYSSATVDNVTICAKIEYAHYHSANFICGQTFLNNGIDTILLTSVPDCSYYDSLVIVRGVGLTSFCTSNGERYSLF